MQPTPPTRISRYEVHQRLGEGGMGILYLARDPLLERTVAIKVLSVYNDELRERFAREARSAASLKHNHIVTIYDVGEDQGRPFIAMEYLDGETMAELIRRRAPLTGLRRLQLILELCDGLGYAHRRGIIHRDIKPANLMITADGVLKILDFGLARITNDVTSAGLTRVGTVLGTPHYMSPEQIEGHAVDQRSDIFAVGLVLYELLCGRKAYAGDAPHTVLHNIIHTEPKPIRELIPDIDPDLEKAIARASEKDPDKRYDSLSLLAADLGRVIGRLSVSADEPTVRLDRQTPSRTPPVSRRTEGVSGTPSSTPRQIPNLDAIARRRAAQIQRHLDEADKYFAEEKFEAAIEACEMAAVLDPNEARALDLLDRCHRGLDDRQVRAWLQEAQVHLSSGALSQAEKLIDQSLQLRPSLAEALQLQRDLKDRRREQERAHERARAVRAALERARDNIDAGAFEAAVRSASEALAYDPGSDEAQELKEQALAALEQQRREQEHEQRAFDLVAESRRLAGAGQMQEALALLRPFSPPHDLVGRAIAELEAEIEALERRKQEEEAARRRRAQEEEERKKEAERLAREREEARRLQEAEEQRRRDAERRDREERAAASKTRAREAFAEGRLAAALAAANEAAEGLPGDQEIGSLLAAIHKARADAEAAARLKAVLDGHLVDSEAALDEGEFTAAQRLVQAALQLSPGDERALALSERIRDAIDRRRRQEERKRAADAAAGRARRMFIAGDYAAAIQLLEEFSPVNLVAPVITELKTEWRRIELRGQEEEARRRQDEDARKQQEQEENARKRQEDEDRKRQEDEAARRRQEEEARKRQDDDARKRQDEDARKRQEEEARKRQEEEKRRREEDAARTRLEQENEARKRQDEARRRQEEEALKRQQQEASRRREEEARKQREDEARKREEQKDRDRQERERRTAEDEARRLQDAAARREREQEARSDATARDLSAPASEADETSTSLQTAASSVANAGAADLRVEAKPGAVGRRVPWPAIAAVAASILIAALVWSKWPHGAGGEKTGGANTAAVEAALTRARTAAQGSSQPDAIAAAYAVLQIDGENAEARRILDGIRTAAAKAATAARQEADSAQAGGQAAYGEARRQEDAASQLKDAKETDRAVKLFADAEQSYRKAAAASFDPSQFLERARQEYKSNQAERAIEDALEALKRDARHGDTLMFLKLMRSDAAGRSTAARAAAAQAGATEATSPPFKQGRARDREAERLTSPEQTKAALDTYAAGERAYREAQVQAVQALKTAQDLQTKITARLEKARERLNARDFEAAKSEIDAALGLRSDDTEALNLRRQVEREQRDALSQQAQKALTLQVDGLLQKAAAAGDAEAVKILEQARGYDPQRQDVIRALEDRRRALNRPPPQPPPPQPQPPQGPTAADEARAIDAALNAYKAAFESKDVDAILRVRPSFAAESGSNYRNTFNNVESYSMDMKCGAAVLEEKNTKASVECRVTTRIRLKRGTSPPSEPNVLTFRMTKAPSGWIVTQAR